MLTLELRGLEQQIVAGLALHAEQIQGDLEAAVRQEIAAFDFDATVKDVANKAIRTSLQAAVDKYFRYGEGASAIDQFVQKRFSGSMPSYLDEVRMIDKLAAVILTAEILDPHELGETLDFISHIAARNPAFTPSKIVTDTLDDLK
jgi:hypothetical protein